MTHREHHDGSPMTNTHILSQAFDYIRPASLEDAIGVLAGREDAKILAGGTNLLVKMKETPASAAEEEATLVDISHLEELRGISEASNGVHIGALTPIRDLAKHPEIRKDYTCLAEAAAAFGSTQVATMGTIGGNIGNGSPASDTVPALVVLGAEATIVGPKGERTALVADLLVGPGRIALEPGELVRSIMLPAQPAEVGSAFLKLTRVRADLAKISIAVRMVREGGTVKVARIALGSVGPTVIRAKRASGSLMGQAFSGDIALVAGRMAAEEITPIDDVRSTADYRCRTAVALTHDALQLAWKRANGEAALPMVSYEVGSAAASPVQFEDTEGVFYVESEERVGIELNVNGVDYVLDVAPNDLLLNVLRERLELTGAKYGCGIGECGACTVWVDGEAVLGCMVLALSVHGKAIRTIEGEAENGQLTELQEAFIEENAFQCGYCTPGMLMMTKKLLEELPQPSEEQIVDYLKGNHCRCTGYASIVRAVRKVSEGSKEASNA